MPVVAVVDLRDRIADWLRPGGLFVASLGSSANPGVIDDDWLGAPMHFSGYAPEDNLRFVAEAGLHVTTARIECILDNDRPATFLWIVARRKRRRSRLSRSAP